MRAAVLLTAAAIILICHGASPADCTTSWASAYHCSSDSRPATISRHDRKDFRLVTRTLHSSSYSPGLVCEFNAELGESSGAASYFVEIESFKVNGAILTVSSGGQVLLRTSNLRSHQSSLSTPSGQLTVRFDARNDNSRLDGVQLRVRAFESSGCPPGWLLLAGGCFGTSNTTSSLSFADAQNACNSMRSNLLQLPLAYLNSVGQFVRKLPLSLRRGYNWIGLTDRTSAGQFRHFWLNGQRQHLTSEISCFGSAGYYTTCRLTERCGTFCEGCRGNYAMYMDNCLDRNKFICSMPPGGTRIFYSVPGDSPDLTGNSSSRSAWMWGGIAVGLLLLCLAVVGVHGLLRTRRSAAAAAPEATGGFGAATAVCRYPEPPPLPPPELAPQYPAAPPTYEAAMAEANGGLRGHCNEGFGK